MSIEYEAKLILGFHYWHLTSIQKEKYDIDWLEDSTFEFFSDESGVICIGYCINNVATHSNLNEFYKDKIDNLFNEFGITPYIFPIVWTY
jgi:hypothetical protein